jgi:NAD(P)-dependent dehydrogenase (short-subunit alcohol dehydrogenase family)
MILVTGASGGIGRSIVPHLASFDAVMGLYNQTVPAAASSDRVSFEPLDLTASSSVAEFVRRNRSRLTRLTVVLLAARKTDGLLVEFDEAAWDSTLATNVTSSFLLLKHLLPLMMAERWGRIVHVSSVAALRGAAGATAYGTSKAAVHGLSRGLAKEYGRFNITSNVLELGYFDVGLIDALPAETRQKLINEIPSRALGRPANIVHAVEFLMKAEFVNGTVIGIDGGI